MSIQSAYDFYGEDVVNALITEQVSGKIVTKTASQVGKFFSKQGIALLGKISQLQPKEGQITGEDKAKAAAFADELYEMLDIEFLASSAYSFLTHKGEDGQILVNEIISDLDDIFPLFDRVRQEDFFAKLSQMIHRLDAAALAIQDKDGDNVFMMLAKYLNDVAEVSAEVAIKMVELLNWGALNHPDAIIQKNNKNELPLDELIHYLDSTLKADDFKDEQGEYDTDKQQKFFSQIESMINRLPIKVQQAQDMDEYNIFHQILHDLDDVASVSPTIARQLFHLVKNASMEVLLMKNNDGNNIFDMTAKYVKDIAPDAPGLAKDMLQFMRDNMAAMQQDTAIYMLGYCSLFYKNNELRESLQELSTSLARKYFLDHGLAIDEVNMLLNKAFYMYKHIKMAAEAVSIKDMDELYDFKNALNEGSGIEGDEGEPCIDSKQSVTHKAYCQHLEPLNSDNGRQFLDRFSVKDGDNDPYPIQEAQEEYLAIRGLLEKHQIGFDYRQLFAGQCADLCKKTVFGESDFGEQVCGEIEA